MYSLSVVVVAFAAGWVVCALTVTLGGWLEKVELYRDYLRIRDRGRIHNGNIRYLDMRGKRYGKEN